MTSGNFEVGHLTFR